MLDPDGGRESKEAAMNEAIRRLATVVAAAALAWAFLAPATGEARVSLERFVDGGELLGSSSLSLAGDPELAWLGAARACGQAAAEARLFSAAELSLPGEVVEDVLLDQAGLAPASSREALAVTGP
jgi:hypothetical protein